MGAAGVHPHQLGGAVRAHTYRYDTHTDLVALGARSAIASILVGSFDSGQWLNANLAVKGLSVPGSWNRAVWRSEADRAARPAGVNATPVLPRL